MENTTDNQERSYAAKVVTIFITAILEEFECSEIHMTLWHLALRLKEENLSFRIPEAQLKSVLEDQLNLKPSNKPMRYTFPIWKIKDGSDDLEPNYEKYSTNRITKEVRPFHGRVYTFTVEQFS